MLQETLSRLQIGTVESRENLSIAPLLTDEIAEPRYLLMQDALAQGLLVIEEVSEGGSVNTIKATNKATMPVLLPDSEELVGAKQNRVLNVSILLAPLTVTLIPVTCVEQGRWGFRARAHAHQHAMAFEASEYMLHVEARSAKAEQVHHSRKFHRAPMADQSAIWAEVRRKMHEAEADSLTSAMHDMYECRRRDIDSYLEGFHPLPNQVGAVFAINDEIVGVEVFDSPSAFQKMFPKLLRSYALTAMTNPRHESHPISRADADEFLNTLAKTPTETFQPVGLGSELHLNNEQVNGCALLHEGRLVHLYAFRRSERRPARDRELVDLF